MGGESLSNDVFLQRLQMMYSGTRRSGTVRILVKRVFDEHFKNKKSKQKERIAKRVEECGSSTREFSLIVKAATPKRRLATLVTAKDSASFQAKMTTAMQSGMFKAAMEQMTKSGKKKAKKQQQKEESKASAKPATGKGAGKKGKQTEASTMNRAERRKVLRKAARKTNRAKLLQEKRTGQKV